MVEFTDLPRRAKAFWLLVVIAGFLSIVCSLTLWPVAEGNLLRFAVYLGSAILASRLKIRLPGIFGTLSMNYVVIILAMLGMSPFGAVIVAVAGTLGQCFFHVDERPAWFRVVFSAGGIPVAVLAAEFVLKSPVLLRLGTNGHLALLAASTMYFAVNTGSVAGIISCSTHKPMYATWRNAYLWTYPQYLVGGGIADATHLLITHYGWPALLVAAPPLYLVYRSYRLYVGRINEQQDHLLAMSHLHLRTIETLALAIEAKDDTTAAHLRRVQIYASEIGSELKLSTDEMLALEAAALLHDVGKLAVPEYIVSKPGKLTEEEFEKMKIHPVVGAEILERVQFPYPVAPIVRSHHEKYDGSGYPDGLVGEAIPLGARILSAVDCLDALASKRQYRAAMPLEDAMAIVAEESGKSYDPKIVAILQRRLRELELKANADTGDLLRLSSNIKVGRGLAPATGFAESETALAVPSPATDFSVAISSARREYQLLNEVTSDLGNSLSLEETLAVMGVRVGRIVEHDTIVIYLLKDDKLIPRYVKGESFRLLSSLKIPIGQGLSGWVAQNDLPIVNGNPAVESGYLDDPQLITSLRSAIAVPLRSNDRLVGVLTLYSLKSAAFTPDHRRMLLAIAPKVAHTIENSLTFEIATNAAETDELTGSMNARYLFAHLQEEVQRNSRASDSFAVILIDLDGFKNANDQYGHLAGNRILQAVAAGLRLNCRAGDVVARLGGDEFVIVLRDAGKNVDLTLARIEETFRKSQIDANCEAVISFSAGISRYPQDGAHAEALLGKADERMYEAKRGKKMLSGGLFQTHAVPVPDFPSIA